MLAMAVGGGFLLVCMCFGLVRAVRQLTSAGGKKRSYSAVPGSGKGEGKAEGADRDEILAEVYGHKSSKDDLDEESPGHQAHPEKDTELAKAWEAIERAVSSDEDNDRDDLVAAEDYLDRLEESPEPVSKGQAPAASSAASAGDAVVAAGRSSADVELLNYLAPAPSAVDGGGSGGTPDLLADAEADAGAANGEGGAGSAMDLLGDNSTVADSNVAANGGSSPPPDLLDDDSLLGADGATPSAAGDGFGDLIQT